MAESDEEAGKAGEASDALIDTYGLTRQRAAEIRASGRALELVVLRCAGDLPFVAEPWGLGEALLRMVRRDEQR